MLGDARRAVIVGALVVFGAGFLVGLAVGSAGDEASPAARPTSSPTVTLSEAPVSPPVATPTPGQEPAIPTQGAILREGDRPVNPAPGNAPCQALVAPGTVGECGEVGRLGDARRVGGRAHLHRGRRDRDPDPDLVVRPRRRRLGRVARRLDPTGETWVDVSVVEADLTGDGVGELLVGFRRTDEAQTLDVDVVGYGQDNLPVVLAHPEPAPRGVVVLTGGAFHEYVAQYPNGEPVCCPSAYLRQTIAFEDGFFRVTEAVTVSPNVVPTSQV